MSRYRGDPSLSISVWWGCQPDDEGREGSAQIGTASVRLARPPSVSEAAWEAWCESLVKSLGGMGESVHKRTLAGVERALAEALTPSLDIGETDDE